ncbi:MAG: hypothetical protein HUU35_04380 [Armatimonadetes bacterium]|nr:hypothetical protein [Armatimonadota bacterium]
MAMEAAGTCTTSDDAAAYVQNWVKAARGRQVVCITMVQKEGGGQPGMTFNNHAGSITDPKRSWFCNEEIIADADRPNNEPATLARARTHTMIHEFCHSLGLSFGCDGTTRCILRESLEQYYFEDMGADVFGADSHRNKHRTQIRGALGHEIRD